MIIAVGSIRGPKVEAAREVGTLLQARFFSSSGQVKLLIREAASGVPAMPTTLDEMMQGAKNRTRSLKSSLTAEGVHPDFLVGMEGGFVVVSNEGQRCCFLQNWAYVCDAERGAFGASGAIPVPEGIARQVLDGGRELADVIDEFAQRRDVRSQEGTWGLLSCDLISRKDAFKIALLNAFAPFYNPRAYSTEASYP
ncbi:MAG: inosine/xanthosine triphosphatase [Acidobacteriia bacterium]|nr:inosine/xanthosine triphosphatase [Terriglobia bacterium]